MKTEENTTKNSKTSPQFPKMSGTNNLANIDVLQAVRRCQVQRRSSPGTDADVAQLMLTEREDSGFSIV